MKQIEFNRKRMIRENIRELKGYSCAREEFSGEEVTLMDANENPYDTGYNRYPDPYQQQLKGVLAAMKKIRTDQLILGNGSDELIDLLIRITCEPNRDNLIVFSPGYSMYEVSARINAVEVRTLDLNAGFMPEWDRLFERVDEHTRLIFFCTPNNPVGNCLPLANLAAVAERFKGLVIVDEAYLDFTEQPSAVNLQAVYPNVVVLQTLSKAWGMAGLRIGLCIADPQLIAYLNKVKPPYNIGVSAQQIALKALAETERFRKEVNTIKEERERLFHTLSQFHFLTQVYPSEANFILVSCPEYKALYDYLIRHRVVTRIRHIPPRIENGLRISVGTPEENEQLIQLLQQWEKVRH
jgi:histidinol-phosphate aminotransferase